MYLENIYSPADVKKLSEKELNELGGEIRAALLQKLSAHGGHVGPNLGMVEATIALHYVFNSPEDKIVFDVSHQSYVHKMLTGRKDAFLHPEKYDNVSGYTEPQESEHDFFNVGHTSTSVSLATGLAKARDIKGDKENIITIDNIVLNHYSDKSKSRGSYLPLLELSVKEDPNDDRNMHYLGREYMYYGKWNECIDTLIKHLNLKSSTWKDERCASMRFIARSYKKLGRVEESKMWYDKAINEAPYLRDSYVERGILEYELDNYKEASKYLNDALNINSHEKTYINEIFSWDNTIYDMLSICMFYLNRIDESLFYIDKAIDMEPNNERLINIKR